MINSFYLDGVDCRDFGIYPTGRNVYDGVKQNVILHRPYARSSVIRHALQTYEPIEIGYTIFTRPELRSKSQSIRDWLLHNWGDGWRRLVDTYDPYHYRKVYDVADMAFERKNDYGESEVVFTCEAFRYLKSAEPIISLPAGTSNTSIFFNPTKYTAYPRITILGSASQNSKVIYINNIRIEIPAPYKDVIIDTEEMDFSDGEGNSLNYMTTVSGDIELLSFQPGENTVRCGFAVNLERRWREI